MRRKINPDKSGKFHIINPSDNTEYELNHKSVSKEQIVIEAIGGSCEISSFYHSSEGIPVICTPTWVKSPEYIICQFKTQKHDI